MSANFHFKTAFRVEDAVLLRHDLNKIGKSTAVVIDLTDVQFITQTAIDALAAALKSIAGRRVFGIGFEGVGIEQFRALGVLC
jgi:anti-anti-sigma regulatory factor